MTIVDLLWRQRRGIRDDKEQRLQGKVAKSMSLTMMMMMMTLAAYHVDGSDELFFSNIHISICPQQLHLNSSRRSLIRCRRRHHLPHNYSY